jgi:hypothetical protein
VAQGLDETEEQESKEKLKQEELAAQDLEYQKSLRSKSKSIINSIYGI